jgi:nucleotide-binding universal stress UspA family protein
LIKTPDPIDFAIRKAESAAYLHETSARLGKADLQIETALTEGRAAAGIIKYAHDHKVSLIALSSHGRSGLSAWNISSVVQKVILRAYTSVLIIPAYQTAEMDLGDFRYQKVFVALDGSIRAEWVLPLAVELAATHHAALLLAHIIPRPVMPACLPLHSEEIEMANRIVERNRREADKYLKQICSRLPADLSPILTYLWVSENPIEALHELAEQESADLVILSAHGYSGGYKRPYGSVALSFIAYGTIPLLILQDLSPESVGLTRLEKFVKEQPGH